MTLPIAKNYAQSPSNRGWVNFKGHPDGRSLDIGWRYSPDNPNQPAYAITDGRVISHGYDSEGGNYLFVGCRWTETTDLWWAIMHLSHPALVGTNGIITQGVMVGNMGNTGKSRGAHFHIRVSEVPRGSAFSWTTANDYRKAPLNYIYAYSHQDVTDLARVPSTPFPVLSGESVNPKYINLNPQEKYGTYNEGVVPVAANISNYLAPINGFSYKILRQISANVYLIGTQDFGKQQIFMDPKRASVSEEPKYELKGEGSSTSPKPTPTPDPKPTPEPKPPVAPSVIGKWVNMVGTINLYNDATVKYPEPSGKTRSRKILDVSTNYYKIDWGVGGASYVWILKSSVGEPTANPLYPNDVGPTPVSYVGQFLNLKGRVNLYNDSTVKYPEPSGKTRSRKILDVSTNYYKVVWNVGGASHVWIRKSDVSVPTASPLYSTSV